MQQTLSEVEPVSLPRRMGLWRSCRRKVSGAQLAPGDVLYADGQATTYLYEVRAGLLKLECLLEDGSYRIVRLCGDGEAVGLEGLFDRPCDHRVVAVTPTVVDKVPLSEVRYGLRSNQSLYLEIFGLWHDSIRRSEAVLTRYTVGPARHRMARLLLDLCAARSEADRVRIALPPGEDMAALISATKETVSRTLSAFVKTGSVVKQRDKMVLVAVDQVRAALD